MLNDAMNLSAISFAELARAPQNAPKAAAFESGERYSAQIVGVVPASSEYQGVVKKGVVLLLAVEDGTGTIGIKSSPFYSTTGAFLHEKAKFGQMLQSLLGTKAVLGELAQAAQDAGIVTVEQLVGRSCCVEIGSRVSKTGAEYYYVEAVKGTTTKVPGLDIIATADTFDVSPYVFSKFLQVDTSRAAVAPCVDMSAFNDDMEQPF